MLTPIDIQNHVLKSTMGGYNKKETDDFIESIQESYEQLYKENHDFKEKVTALSEGLQYYKQMEGTLQKTLMLAEKTATETLEASRTKASKVEKESQQKANVMLSSAKAKADAIVNESEEKVNALLAESREKADALLNESKAKAEEMLTQSHAKSETAVAEAQKKAEYLLANANERVERVITDAKETADVLLDKTRTSTEQMLYDANEQLSEVTSTVQKLIDCYNEYKEQFKEMLHRQLEQLDDPAFLIQVPDLKKTLESQQVAIAKKQTSLHNELDKMEYKTKELDLPVEDTPLAGTESHLATSDWEINSFDGENSVSSESEATAENLIEELSEEVSDHSLNMEDAFQAAAEAITAMKETASVAETDTDNGGTEGAASLEALARMADTAAADMAAPEGMEPTAFHAEDENRERDFADIALEALRRANSEVIPKAPIVSDESSVLGTSYDDFVPESQGPDGERTVAAQQEDYPSPSSTEEQKVIPMPDFARAMEIPTFEEELGQPTVPMPDFARTMEASTYEGEPEQPTVPMPDFARAMEAPTYEGEPEQPTVPMPDFAKVIAEEQIPPQTVIQPEEYITNETYFGSADNIPYTGAVADFSNGIGGEEVTEAANQEEEAADLFSADFSGAATAPADEFAVGGAPASEGQEMPFTFINANDAK